jgi:hypothetical protein
MTEVINDTLTKDRHDEYLEKLREYGKKYYHDRKQLKTKYVCKFVNYRGEHCKKTSFHEYCSVHRKRLGIVPQKTDTNDTIE